MKKVNHKQVINALLCNKKTYKQELYDFVMHSKEYIKAHKEMHKDNLPEKWEDFINEMV